MRKPLLHLFILVLSLVFLSGCKIDGEEEITLHSDGSGDIRIHFILPYKAFSKKDAQQVHSFLSKIVERHPELTLLENDSCPYGRFCQALKLHISFESAFDLERIILTEKAYFETQTEIETDNSQSLELVNALLGTVNTGIHPLGIQYQREVDLSPLFKNKINNGAILGDAEFRYILNTPMEPDSANATSIVNGSTTKLTWHIPLQKHYNQPFVLEANYARTEAYAIWSTIGIAAIICFFLLYRKIKRVRSS